MRNFLRICFLFLAIFVAENGFSQTITVGSSFNVGPYGEGSSITVPIQLGGIFNTNEKFEIYLSDATGNFSPGTKIGEYASFYTTFVNGVIPTGTIAGTGYKIEVRTTSTGSVKVATAAFSIVNTPGLSVVVTPPQNVTELKTNEVFGSCLSNLSGTLVFNLTGNIGSTSNIAIKDETNTPSSWTNKPGSSTFSYTINSSTKSHYTMIVKSSLNGIIATRGYFLINNQNLNPFTAEYNGVICLPGNLNYSIPYVGEKSIAMNFPGSTYQINWGDGTAIQILIIEEIKSLFGSVSHSYTTSSCGKNVTTSETTYYNSIGPSILTNNPFCGSSAPTITIARVITRPENQFNITGSKCVNNTLTLSNQSVEGTSGSQTEPGCTPNTLLYNWFVYLNNDWELIPNAYQVPRSFSPTISFSTPGEYQIKLSAIDPTNKIPCIPDDIIKTICIEQTPAPDFKFLQGNTELETIKGCAPLSIVIKDKSNVLNVCSTPTYEWTLKNLTTNSIGFSQNGSTFQNGTNANSVAPEFIINNPGNYALTLTISNNCAIGGISKTKNFTVVGPPAISNFNYPITYCETLPKVVDFVETYGF